MVAWRSVSGHVGRIQPDVVANMLADTGFEQIEIAETLGGLGMHSVARVRPTS